MKTKLFLACLLISAAVTFALLAFSGEPQGKCTGSKSCTACKNCKYCKHCAKDGGTCGVCKK